MGFLVTGAVDVERVLVTGAIGFVGQRLVDSLLVTGVTVCALVRPGRLSEAEDRWSARGVTCVAGDLSSSSTLGKACTDISTVFHLAGYAHADDATDPRLDEKHWSVTVEGTRALLNEAIHAGVKKFVFVSTVKAIGEDDECLLDEESPANPSTGYGRAKHAAEQLVLDMARKHGFHAVVLRLPIVYGAGNRGNIPRMISAIDAGRFPPLPETHNRRSMVHVDDVIQALLLVASLPESSGQIYLVTDGQVYSTRQIELLIRQALGKPVPGWVVPMWAWQIGAWAGDFVGWLLRRRLPLNSYVLGKLFGSAWYSDAKIRRDLGYVSRYTLVDALPAMVAQSRARRLDAPSGHRPRS